MLRRYKTFFLSLFLIIGLLGAVIVPGPSAQAQQYDCGTYSAGDYGDGECDDEGVPSSVTPSSNSSQGLPVTDTTGPQPDNQTESDSQVTPDPEQTTDTTASAERQADNSFLLWLILGLVVLGGLILVIWLITRRTKRDT